MLISFKRRPQPPATLRWQWVAPGPAAGQIGYLGQVLTLGFLRRFPQGGWQSVQAHVMIPQRIPYA